jgi:hypothetical protein
MANHETDSPETLEVAGPEHADLLDAFHNGIYVDAFAHQIEPLDVWKRRLWSCAPSPYQLTIRIAGRELRDPMRREIDGGIVYELYRHSRCGLLTYMVIARERRRAGLGHRLLSEATRALYAAGAVAVFGEVSDPAKHDDPHRSIEAWERIELFQRWGGRVVDTAYVQPELGVGLERDRGLRLLMFPGDATLPRSVPGPLIATFLEEFYAITEGAPPDDPELVSLVRGLGGAVMLRELRRPEATSRNQR